MTESPVETLKLSVEYLKDRLAIQDCIARHARGHDRHDLALITSTYWGDGFDEHGNALNAGPQYAEWANSTHAGGSCLHTHNITCHSCEIEGDVAHCESYVIVALLNRDEMSSRFISGRYIDRLERRDGEWKIALRRSIVDTVIAGDASMLKNPLFKEMGYTRGTWDRTDISYDRPLSLKTPATKW